MIKLADTLAPMSNNFYVVESENVGIDIDGTSKSIQQAYEDGDLSGGGSSIQVDTMPIASVNELGKIYEFIGSTGTYVNGYFYECVSDGEPTPTYSWVQKNVQPNAESFTFNSDEFAVDSATNEVSLKPSYADIPSFLPNNVSSSNKLATNSSITAITDLIPSDASATNKLVTKNDLADKQDFRIFNSLEEFNEKKGTSLTVVSGIDNMKDIANAMSNGEILIIIVRYELGSEVYFGLDKNTGWTKMFTFIKSNGICDVECRTSTPATFKRLLNSDGLIGDWQELATTDSTLKTYTSIEQLGLTIGSETIEDIANNMEDRTRLITLIFESDNNVSIYPYRNGTLIVEKINIYRVNLKFYEDISNNVYVGTYHGEKGFTGWKRLCATSVADVPITYINAFEDETYVKPTNTNLCSYYVSNGNCIISIELFCLSTSTNFTQIISGLPKPKTTLYANAIDRTMNSNSGARGLFQLTRNGDLNITCDYGDTSVVTSRYFYVSFSYSVA